MSATLDQFRLESPILQAGMGGGLSTHELAVAVSTAGGLGTIGMLDLSDLRREVATARRQAGDRPIAVNLLLPFARRAHFQAASQADVVFTFWGTPRRRTPKLWVHQCGSVAEARQAHAAGADGVIAQGVEAGGHVRGSVPAVALLAQVRAALPDGFPVFSAGGIADAADVRARLDAGADGVVCGTRFVLTDECRAHPSYKARLLSAQETVLTELFGLSWPAPHRVVPNAATARWLTHDRRGPTWVRRLQRASAPLLSHGPGAVQFGLLDRVATAQRPGVPLYGPSPALVGGAESLVDAGALYAGESVARISDIRPAADVVRELT